MSITVLIVDDEDNFRSNMSDILSDKDYEVIGAASLSEARLVLGQGNADIVLLDVELPDGYGPNLLAETHHLPFRPPTIIITGVGDIEMAVDAMKNGAHDFLTKPIHLPRLEQSIQRANEMVLMRREVEHWRHSQRQGVDFIIGNSAAMLSVVDQAERASAASVSVLITGETGTGKEILAKHIHKSGQRKDKPLIDINCAAIQSTMLESELFGYEAGAFTGADRRKHGLMEVADGGILFLDEISSMPLDMQAKLLRALEERAFRRVGGTNLIKVDVQIIAASNRNLMALINENLFRGDLYYRLKVADLHLPPLRDRIYDIPELVGYFIRKHNSQLGLNVQNISPGAMQAMQEYSWPGNIRELSNVIERSLLFCDSDTLDIENLPSDIVN
jgi:two-component system, NtrC family, response regulator AtoC